MAADSPSHVVELLDRAFNAGDLEGVLSFYENSAAVVTDPSGAIRRDAALRDFFAAALRSGNQARQLKTRVIEGDGIALFLSRWQLRFVGANHEASELTLTATTVLRKQPDDSWKIAIDNPFGPLILGPE
jgi:ketosteroid isomerase-like protein